MIAASLPLVVEQRTLTVGQAFLYVLRDPHTDTRTVLCTGCGSDCGIRDYQGWGGEISSAVDRHQIGCMAQPNALYTIKEQQ